MAESRCAGGWESCSIGYGRSRFLPGTAAGSGHLGVAELGARLLHQRWDRCSSMVQETFCSGLRGVPCCLGRAVRGIFAPINFGVQRELVQLFVIPRDRYSVAAPLRVFPEYN